MDRTKAHQKAPRLFRPRGQCLKANVYLRHFLKISLQSLHQALDPINNDIIGSQKNIAHSTINELKQVYAGIKSF